MARTVVSGCALSLALAGPLLAARPIAVSPGNAAGDAVVAGRCPTFHWSAPADSVRQELVIYPAPNPPPESAESLDPVLRLPLPGGMTSWAPDLSHCLEPGGRYAWSVRVERPDGETLSSEATFFRVSSLPSEEEVEEALSVLERLRSASAAEQSAASGGRAPSPASSALASPTVGAYLSPAPGAGSGAPLTEGISPLLGTASLTVDQQVHLGVASQLFKDGKSFLWSGTGENLALGENAITGTRFYGSRNTAVGYNALKTPNTGYPLVVANDNVAVGNRALEANTLGADNVAIGSAAMQLNTTGARNVAVGWKALRAGTNASIENTAVGAYALTNTTGSSNIGIGPYGGGAITTGYGNISIGSPGSPYDGTTYANQVIRLGSVQDATYIAGIRGVTTYFNNALPVLIDSGGQLGTTSSSIRFKSDVHELGDLSSRLLGLRPVSFRFRKHHGEGPPSFGLIAEEVAAAFPELVVNDPTGRPMAVRYDQLSALLLNEMQRQDRRVASIARLVRWEGGALVLCMIACGALAILRTGR